MIECLPNASLRRITDHPRPGIILDPLDIDVAGAVEDILLSLVVRENSGKMYLNPSYVVYRKSWHG